VKNVQVKVCVLVAANHFLLLWSLKTCGMMIAGAKINIVLIVIGTLIALAHLFGNAIVGKIGKIKELS
jgi:hypothetical protein